MQDRTNTIMRKVSFYDFISIALKGISQVILIENAISGLIILVALVIMDYKLGLMALVSAIIGTLIAYVGGADKNVVGQGLFGYNSVLVGLSLYLFLSGNIKWGVALVGAAFASIFTAAMIHTLRKMDIPVLTFPFVITTWFFLLASYKLQELQLITGLLPQGLADLSIQIGDSPDLINGLLYGIGQVYFQSNLWSGILILVAVFWGSWELGVYAILGTIIGFGTAYVLGGEYTLLNLGLYGYNAVLTMITIRLFKGKTQLSTIVTGIVAAMVTVPITASINTFLIPYGIPVLTMPFVVVSWIFLGARKVLPKI